MNYTKGPWVTCNGTDVFTDIGATNSNGVKADDCDGWQIADCSAGITFVDGLERTMRLPEMQANARLISATPDLYEALKASLRYIEFVGGNETEKGNDHPQQMLIDQIEAALSKAEGK